MTETAKETKAQLARALGDMGINQKDFDGMRKAYDELKGGKRLKADFDSWLAFGKVGSKMKVHLNKNNKALGNFRKSYFSEMSAQDLSNAIWLHDNKAEVKGFCKGKSLSNPAGIKNAIRKELKEEGTKEDYDKYGLEMPKNRGTVKKKSKASKEVENVSSLNKMYIAEVLKVAAHAVEVLQQRARDNKKQFKDIEVTEIDKLSLDLSDLATSLHHAHDTEAEGQATGTDG